MGEWDDRRLVVIDDGDEVDIQARRDDGTLREPVIIWSVRLGRHLYVRSATGPEGRWFRHLLETGRGRVGARGVCEDVVAELVDPDSAIHEGLDREYHRKYDRHAPWVDPVVGPHAAFVTLRLTPEA